MATGGSRGLPVYHSGHILSLCLYTEIPRANTGPVPPLSALGGGGGVEGEEIPTLAGSHRSCAHIKKILESNQGGPKGVSAIVCIAAHMLRTFWSLI